MYTREQIKEGLRNRFIQVHICTEEDYKNIISLLREMFPISSHFPTIKPLQSIYIFCQVFNDNSLGWNGSLSQNIYKNGVNYFENADTVRYTIINANEINF